MLVVLVVVLGGGLFDPEASVGNITTHVHVALTGETGHGDGPSVAVHVDVTVWPLHEVLAGHVVRVVVLVVVVVTVDTGGSVGQLQA